MASIQDMLDTNIYADLQEMMGEDLMDIYREFIQEADVAIEQIQATINQKDTATLREQAHRLKSSSSNLGIIAISQACNTLEQQAKAGTTENAEPLIAQIIEVNAALAKCDELM